MDCIKLWDLVQPTWLWNTGCLTFDWCLLRFGSGSFSSSSAGVWRGDRSQISFHTGGPGFSVGPSGGDILSVQWKNCSCTLLSCCLSWKFSEDPSLLSQLPLAWYYQFRSFALCNVDCGHPVRFYAEATTGYDAWCGIPLTVTWHLL